MVRRQRALDAFLGKPSKRQKSAYGVCPLCNISFPKHNLERHAATCDGTTPSSKRKEFVPKRRSALRDLEPTSEPIPGLFLFEEFISKEEEREILAYLDSDKDIPWKPATFNGRHRGKRWGVHCNLRSRSVDPAETPLPDFMTRILLPRLKGLPDSSFPNESNAIDYRKSKGDYLKAHVDDRQLSKEPIINLSLAGECFMTFRNTKHSTAQDVHKVLLKPRCLQILTGKARYDFSHAIDNSDLLSDRRVSLTMRESPLTKG